jgi:hypothetical protein
MKEILHIKFGSHLYGTNTENSDFDYKKIFIPNTSDIILQRVTDTYNTQRPKGEGEKNYAGEEECESFSLQKFLGLAAQGQTVALDILFAPDSAFVGPISYEWKTIRQNKHKLITKKSTSFVKYCQQQANKYGIKGSRVAASRKALELLNWGVDTYGSSAQIKLSQISTYIKCMCEKTDHMAIVPIKQIGGQIIEYWEVCGRKLQYTASLVHARDVIQKMVDEYGGRALQAERQEGIDWKALSHAVRIGRQAIELLNTHKITFPLPYAEEVLAIKTGKRLFQDVSREIDSLLEQVVECEKTSTLPADVDYKWIDNFVYTTYLDSVLEGLPTE